MTSTAKKTGADAAPTKDEDAWPFEFPLKKPATALGETYSALSLREPVAADYLKHGVFDDNIDGAQLLDLIAQLSGLTPATVRALPGNDMLKLSKKLMQRFHRAAQ